MPIIEPANLEAEMKSAYMDYAMSVIVGRALPDVRDGLKPVHRRTLYGMHNMGLAPNWPYSDVHSFRQAEASASP